LKGLTLTVKGAA